MDPNVKIHLSLLQIKKLEVEGIKSKQAATVRVKSHNTPLRTKIMKN